MMDTTQFEKRLEEGGFTKLCEKYSIGDVRAVRSYSSGQMDGFDVTEWVFEGYKMPERKKFVVSTNLSDTLIEDTAFNLADIVATLIGDFVKDLAQKN